MDCNPIKIDIDDFKMEMIHNMLAKSAFTVGYDVWHGVRKDTELRSNISRNILDRMYRNIRNEL